MLRRVRSGTANTRGPSAVGFVLHLFWIACALAALLAPRTALAQPAPPPPEPAPPEAPAAAPEAPAAPPEAPDTWGSGRATPPPPDDVPAPPDDEPGDVPARALPRTAGPVGLSDAGVTYTLEAIEVRGNTRTRSRVILRYVPF
jgi:hypothetical protein